MKKYLQLLRINLSVSLEYRGNLLIWTLVEIVSLSSVLFLWTAIFKTNHSVGSYSYGGIVSYYFIVPVINGLTAIFLSEHLPRKIKDGDISTDLMKPFHIGFASLINQFSIKLTQLTIKFPIYIAIWFLINRQFQMIYDPISLVWAFAICIPAYILHYLIDLLISYCAFWMDDIWALSLLKYVTLMIFGGLTFPLDLLPSNVSYFFNILPFRFIYYFPAQVALGRITGYQLMHQLAILMFWIVSLVILTSIVWKSGLKKYGAYGN